MRIEGVLPQQLLQILTKSALESLDIGDFIQGRAASVKDGMLLMKLMDGSSFTASLPGDMNIPEGTFLTLQIGERIGDRLTARIISQGQESKQAEQSLTSSVGEQLRAFGGKATEELVSKVLELVEGNPSLDIGKASFLVANRMEPDKGMHDMVIKLAQNEFQIDANLASLKELMGEALPKIGGPALDALLGLLTEDSGMERAVSNLAERLVQTLSQAVRESGVSNASIPSDWSNPTRELTSNLSEILSNAGVSVGTTDMDTIMNLVKEALAATKGPQNQDVPLADIKIPANAISDAVSEFLSGMAESKDEAGMLQKAEPAMVKQVVEKLIEKAFIKAEGGVADPVDLNEKVNALKNVLTFADEAMKLVDPKSAQTGIPVVRELQNALVFFNQANTYHAFVQIPLMINRHQTTGELYIMKRKSKRGRIDPNQFTLFISLNTQNLGLVETFLNASNKCVTINFRVEDEGLAGFFKSHWRVLYEALNKKGYTLAEMKCRLHSENRVNLLDAMKAAEESLGMNTRIDLKI